MHQQRKLDCLLKIGEVQLLINNSNLQDLQSAVCALALTRQELIQAGLGNNEEAALPIKNMLLRELRPDSLPGKCLWLVDTAGGNLGTTSLKKLSIKPERGLVLQILPSPQQQSRPAAGAIKVWVQRLVNPLNAGNGNAIMSPSWPPLPTTIVGGNSPSMGHLYRAIQQVFPDLTSDVIVVYKYHIPTQDWQEMKSEVTVGKKKTIENLFRAPFNVKEGTLFCVFSKLELGKATQDKIEISLATDLYMQQLRLELKLKQKAGGRGARDGSSGSDVKTGRRPELALTMNIDLDDWDED